LVSMHKLMDAAYSNQKGMQMANNQWCVSLHLILANWKYKKILESNTFSFPLCSVKSNLSFAFKNSLFTRE
jgi:hypothetical protein